MQVRLLSLFLVLFASADVVAAEDAIVQEGKGIERPARIRLFGQNGVGMTMLTNAYCRKQYDEEIEVSGSVSHGFRALVGKKRENETIGMPETEYSRGLAARDKLLASPYYLEYPLMPGQPLALTANIPNGSGWNCNGGRGVSATFVPEPGVDYEGDMVRDFSGGSCGIAIRRIAADGSVSPVPAGPLPAKCGEAHAETPRVTVMLLDGERLQYRLAEEGADIDELDNDDDSIEDLEEMIAEAPKGPVCLVAAAATDASELGRKLPTLLAARAAQGQVIRGDAQALAADWLAGKKPLNFGLAEYYCRAMAGSH